MDGCSEVLRILPQRLKETLERGSIRLDTYNELRIRQGRPVVICRGKQALMLHNNGGLSADRRDTFVPAAEELQQILLLASGFSVFSVEEQLKEGFLTIEGGHRIGVAGEMVEEDGQITGMKNISSYNIRIAHEVKGCGEKVLPWLMEEGQFLDTIILSAPGQGKTTLLRDIVRLLSDGFGEYAPMQVGLADERGELAACVCGQPQNDVGQNTDVIDKGAKEKTLSMLLRTMNPQVLATDEIGKEEEAWLLQKAVSWGTRLITTLHGEMDKNRLMLLGLGEVFDRYVEIKSAQGKRYYRIYDRGGRLLAQV